MRVGSSRSAGVIERMIASTRATSRSSIWPAACRTSLETPGKRRMMPDSEPSLLDLLQLLEEVLEGEPALEQPVGRSW